MRRPVLFGLIMGITLMTSFTTEALAGDQRWLALNQNERVLVDRMASDIYQSAAMQSYQAQSYVPANNGNGNAYGQQRQNVRRRIVPWTRLTPPQKAPFRRMAMDNLGAQMPAQTRPNPHQYNSGRNI